MALDLSALRRIIADENRLLTGADIPAEYQSDVLGRVHGSAEALAFPLNCCDSYWSLSLLNTPSVTFFTAPTPPTDTSMICSLSPPRHTASQKLSSSGCAKSHYFYLSASAYFVVICQEII